MHKIPSLQYNLHPVRQALSLTRNAIPNDHICKSLIFSVYKFAGMRLVSQFKLNVDEVYMKKLLLSLAVILPTAVFAAESSVYAWGPWAEGIKPAAGPVYVAPAPVSEPQVDTRESMALLRQYNGIQPPSRNTPGTDVHTIASALPLITTVQLPSNLPPP